MKKYYIIEVSGKGFWSDHYDRAVTNSGVATPYSTQKKAESRLKEISLKGTFSIKTVYEK